MRGTSITVAWTLTRLVPLCLLLVYQGVLGDVTYFQAGIDNLPESGFDAVLAEYPLPAVLVVSIPWVLTRVMGAPALYPLFFVLLVLAADALFTATLARTSAERRRPALAFWLAAVPLIGGLALARFDLIAGILAALGLLAVGRPVAAAGLVSLATVVKLWPVLCLPPVLRNPEHRTRSVVVVFLVGAVSGIATVLLGGWHRVWSPLSYQLDRGLHVESVVGTPVVIAWAAGPTPWRVSYSRFKSFDVTGPGVSETLLVSSCLTVALAVALVALWVRLWHNRHGNSVDAVAWTALAAISGYIASAKVFSPQYLLWLLPVTAVALAVNRSHRHVLVRWSVTLLVVTGLSQVLYPVAYVGLHERGWQTAVAVSVLLARNLLVVALFGTAYRLAWQFGTLAAEQETETAGAAAGSH
jgi:uncharacterized membrane protein